MKRRIARVVGRLWRFCLFLWLVGGLISNAGFAGGRKIVAPEEVPGSWAWQYEMATIVVVLICYIWVTTQMWPTLTLLWSISETDPVARKSRKKLRRIRWPVLLLFSLWAAPGVIDAYPRVNKFVSSATITWEKVSGEINLPWVTLP